MYLAKHIKKYWFIPFGLFFFFMFVKPVVCLLILGAMFFWFSVAGILVLNKIQQQGIRGTGKIVAFEKDSDGDSTPLIEFKTMNGQLITEKPVVYTQGTLNSFRLTKGIEETNVPILYHPDDPTQFVLAGESSSNYLMLGIFALLGAAASAASIGSLLGYFDIGL